MKTAIVTGITGQDGAYLAALLLTKGYKVYGTYRRTSSVNFWRIQELEIASHPNLELVEYDLTDLSASIRLLNKTNAEEIYNLAAQSFVSVSFEQPITTAEITGILKSILLDGWNELENWGIWSSANAEMQIDLPKDCQGNDECELKLNLGYGVFNAATVKPKQIAVKINNKLIKDWIFNSWGVGDYSMNIPLDAKTLQGQTKNIKIQFHIPAAESPKQIGMSEDARILGMSLSAYQLIKRNVN